MTDSNKPEAPAATSVESPSGARFASIDDAIEAFRRGRMLIVVDDEDRENEGDLTIAAEKVTPDAINFMARYGRGLICLSMTGQRLDALDIPMIVSENTSRFETAFAVPIDAKHVTTTGISAADRSATIRVAIDPATRPADLAKPGQSLRCAPATAGCWCAPARRRRQSISPGSPVSIRPGSSARS